VHVKAVFGALRVEAYPDRNLGKHSFFRGAGVLEKYDERPFWRVRRDAGVDPPAEKNIGTLIHPSDGATGARASSLSATVTRNGRRFGATFASRVLDPAMWI